MPSSPLSSTSNTHPTTTDPIGFCASVPLRVARNGVAQVGDHRAPVLGRLPTPDAPVPHSTAPYGDRRRRVGRRQTRRVPDRLTHQLQGWPRCTICPCQTTPPSGPHGAESNRRVTRFVGVSPRVAKRIPCGDGVLSSHEVGQSSLAAVLSSRLLAYSVPFSCGSSKLICRQSRGLLRRGPKTEGGEIE